MKYKITYTAEDAIEWEQLDEEQKETRTRVVEFTSKLKAIGFCYGIEAMNGFIIKREKI
jgi:hypothetical protein